MPDILEPSRHVKPFVHESLHVKALHFSIHEIQSRMRREDPHGLDLEYTRTMMGFLLFEPAPRDIVMIGLGGGSLAKFCHHHLPQSRIRVVEINPHVIALRDAFDVPPDDTRFQVVPGDGARFVRGHDARCNVLLVDGFDSAGQPASLSSQRFYDDCFAALAPDGILVVNLHGSHALYRSFVERIRRSFDGSVLVVGGVEHMNSIVFAFKGPTLAALRRDAACRPQQLDTMAAEQLRASFAWVLAALHDTPR